MTYTTLADSYYVYHTFFGGWGKLDGKWNNFEKKPSQVLFNFLSWIKSLIKYPVKGLGSMIKCDKNNTSDSWSSEELYSSWTLVFKLLLILIEIAEIP